MAMDWILHRLACGSLDDAVALATHPPLRTINRVLTLSEQIPLLSTIHTHYAPIPDETWLPRDLWQARVDTLRMLLSVETTVLVHCRLGHSRSPALCAAYLVSCGMSCDEARALVEARHPDARIHHETWRGVVDWAGEQRGMA